MRSVVIGGALAAIAAGVVAFVIGLRAPIAPATHLDMSHPADVAR